MRVQPPLLRRSVSPSLCVRSAPRAAALVCMHVLQAHLRVLRTRRPRIASVFSRATWCVTPRPRQRAPFIALTCAQDGTILDSASQIPPRNVSAVARLLSETDVLFVPATGKSRVGALRGMGDLGDLLRTRHPLGVPGVFAQGLLVYGARGEVLYEDGLEDGLAARVAEVAERFDLSLIAYSRDDILSAKRTSFTDLLPSYHVRFRARGKLGRPRTDAGAGAGGDGRGRMGAGDRDACA